MSSSEVSLYTSMLFKANAARNNTFTYDPILLRKMSGLSRGKAGTFLRSMESLQVKQLVVADGERMTLCNPLTGEPHVGAVDAANDPTNYFTRDGDRIVFNVGNPDALLKLVEASLPAGGDLFAESNGEYKLRCPFHSDRTPSLNFNPSKNTFHCFGCAAKGTIRKLVMQLKGIDEGEAIQQHARAIGIDPVFEPDSGAEAEYRYTDHSGKLLYRVLRYPGKRFSQQRWTPEGWVHNLNGVKKTLYNLPKIDGAAVVFVTEGEKDADRINELEFKDRFGRSVVATTSGNAKSWQDAFADALSGTCYRYPEFGLDGAITISAHDPRFVVVMPDSDTDGKRYKEDIIRSLKKRKIPFCAVTFDGFKDVSEYLDADHTGKELAQRITNEMMKIDEQRRVTQPETLAEISI